MRSGITRRWLQGSLLITVLLVLLVEVMFLYSTTRSYYNGVQQTMYRRFSSITGQLKMYTGETSQKTAASRSVALRRMVEQFSDKDKYEFMLLDSYGGVIASSSGTDAEGIVTSTDFEQAQEAMDGQGVAIYRTQSGEMVMAACCLVPYAAEDVAAMRLVTSLTLVGQQLKRTAVVALIMGTAVLAFTIMSGLYFVRSIVVPLGQVERTAASIARGELDVRLPVTGDERDEVDRLRGILHGGKSFLAQMEAEEKEKTGIRTLKIGYNKVFGYYIEVSNSFKDQVPDHYIRKQTLVNGERYITQELKDLEHDVLTAKDRDAALEYELFSSLRTKLAEAVTRVQLAASLIAQLDTLCSFAAVAVKNNYCRPSVDESGVIEIQGGRHPVVEKMRSDALFVPNDTVMGVKEDRVSIITGPNMAGKSTYMRQVALIVLMAQVGSFVPAHDAHIGVVDRIFTRIGASDDLSAGQSTFMVEMTEVSDILRTATKNSLLILDEIGRGTSTFDGMSIARAVLEYCAQKLKAKTLFATHYHELTALDQTLPNVRNYNIAVRARGEDIIFLRKIVPGGADRSYGIEVAKLAGLPDSVLKRARAILEDLESQSGRPAPAAPPEDQLSLSAMAESEAADTIRRTQVDSLSPLEALNLLYELKRRLS